LKKKPVPFERIPRFFNIVQFCLQNCMQVCRLRQKKRRANLTKLANLTNLTKLGGLKCELALLASGG
jgi:hypothetical protein